MNRYIGLALILLSFPGISHADTVTVRAADVHVTTVPGGSADNAFLLHQDNTAAHGAVSANTPNRIVVRDGAGRAQVAPPSVDNDIATKSYVDALSLTGLASYRNLKITTTGAGADQTVLLTADKVLLLTAGGTPLVRSTVSLAINLAASGANSLDNGSLAANTGYYLYVIDNTTTTAGLASTSATAPVLPTGYTYKALLGWCTTDNTATPFNIEEFTQIDDVYKYSTAVKIVNAGSSGTAAAIPLDTANGLLTYNAVPSSVMTKGVNGTAESGGESTVPDLFLNPTSDFTTSNFKPEWQESKVLPGAGYAIFWSWSLRALQEERKLYYATTGTTFTLYLNGFTLKR